MKLTSANIIKNTDKDFKSNFANTYRSLISMKSVFNIKMSSA